MSERARIIYILVGYDGLDLFQVVIEIGRDWVVEIDHEGKIFSCFDPGGQFLLLVHLAQFRPQINSGPHIRLQVDNQVFLLVDAVEAVDVRQVVLSYQL